ncbi:MAG: radical SAM protein [Syntrophales bacterium]
MFGTAGYHIKNLFKAYRNIFIPYIRNRISPGEFRPIVSYLYTDLSCNLDCHYCYSHGKRIPAMTMEVARDAVDWLVEKGCGVLAYMGGEPLLRKSFILELTRYAAGKGMFVYLPTNGILLDESFVDSIGNAGVAAVNLAVDAVDGYEGLPKALNRIKPQFEYLVKQEKKYNYITFLNINITRRNVRDVKELTEIARRHGIATDYHINEPPPIKYDAFRHDQDGDWITEEEFRDVDDLVDWLIARNRQGYNMVNSIEHLRLMKQFIRHELSPWACQAGKLTMVIRLDGSFAPCFEFYGSDRDWGSIYTGHKFDMDFLDKMKSRCSRHCLSTCNYQTFHYSCSLHHSLQWVSKHAYNHFFGIS